MSLNFLIFAAKSRDVPTQSRCIPATACVKQQLGDLVVSNLVVCNFLRSLAPFLRSFAPFVGGSQKVVSRRVVLADVPRYQKPERGYIRMFPGANTRNEGTFGCSLVSKPERGYIRQKPPFYETALLFPIDFLRICICVLLRSIAHTCVSLRPTVFRSTALGNSRNRHRCCAESCCPRHPGSGAGVSRRLGP